MEETGAGGPEEQALGASSFFLLSPDPNRVQDAQDPAPPRNGCPVCADRPDSALAGRWSPGGDGWLSLSPSSSPPVWSRSGCGFTAERSGGSARVASACSRLPQPQGYSDYKAAAIPPPPRPPCSHLHAVQSLSHLEPTPPKLAVPSLYPGLCGELPTSAVTALKCRVPGFGKLGGINRTWSPE